MKKNVILISFAFVFISTQLNCWKSFTIKNNTKNPIIIDNQKIATGESKSIFNKNKLSRNKTVPQKGIAIDNNQVKVSETNATNPERTYLKSSIIIINKNAKQRIINASDIFNEKLPEGFTFKKYATGLIHGKHAIGAIKQKFKKFKPKEMITPTLTTIKNLIKKTKRPLIYIENDTYFPTSLISTDKQGSQEIKPIRIDKKNKKLKKIDKFRMSPILYENFKLKKDMVGLTRFRFVSKDNIISLNVKTPNTTYKFEIKILPDCKEGSVLKISSLFPTEGFEIISHKKINIKLLK